MTLPPSPTTYYRRPGKQKLDFRQFHKLASWAPEKPVSGVTDAGKAKRPVDVNLPYSRNGNGDPKVAPPTKWPAL